MKTAGFVGVIGNTNAGKSTLLNALSGENLTLVSHKINATRKRMNVILMYENQDLHSQIVMVDTPGIHTREKLLNKFMMTETLRAMQDCEILLFVASATDGIEIYENFLKICRKNHVVALNKIDLLNRENQARQILKYQKFADKFLALMPISAKKMTKNYKNSLLKILAQNLPKSEFLFPEDDLSDMKMRDIYKEKIRESLFEFLSDELPYESDVAVQKVISDPKIEKIFADIVVKKDSQKAMVIGKNGATLRRIGQNAREKIEIIAGKKAYLSLTVVTKRGWSTQKAGLKKLGYEFKKGV